MLSTLLNRPCTIVQRLSSTEKDAHGREQPEQRLIETVCEVQQRTRREPSDDLSDTTWDGFFPPGTQLNTGDAVIVDGIGEFELVGDPWQANTGSLSVAHVEATLRRTRSAEGGS